MKTTEIRELSTKEIEEKVQLEQENLNKMKLNHVITPLENPNKLKEARKTVLSEREQNK